MENYELHRQILGLPEYVMPAAMLVFGYPTQQQLERPKPRRCDMKYMVYENRYQRANPDQLREMLGKGLEGTAYADWISAFCARKYNSDFARELNRSVREYLKQYDGEEGDEAGEADAAPRPEDWL